MSEDGECLVPECNILNCELNCADLTADIVRHAREEFYRSAKQSLSERTTWINLNTRPISRKMTVQKIHSMIVVSGF